MTRFGKVMFVWAAIGICAMTTTVLAQRGRAVGQERGNDVAAVRAAIEAGNKKFNEGAMKKDAALIASVYSPDAVAYPANSDAVSGRPALQKLWQSVLASGINGFELHTTEVDAAGDIAYEVGTYTMKAGDKIADRGKYVVVWKRINGQWFLHRDIWTTSMPAPK